MHGYKIRPYRDADFERLCEIHDAARLDELRLSNRKSAFVPLAKAAKNEGLFDYCLVVAELRGTIDGFVAYKSDELGWLYVWPAAYRRGIATLLTHQVIKNGGPSMRLEVLDGNDPAFKLYEMSGFRFVEQESGGMAGNEAYAVTVNVMEFSRR